MSWTFESTNVLATKVLQAVKRIARAKTFKPKGSVAVYPYFNGRERGWTLVWYPDSHDGPPGDALQAVSFSENRNSDELVIYPGNFSFRHTRISDEAWLTRQYVKAGPQQVVQAAKAVIEALLKGEQRLSRKGQ